MLAMHTCFACLLRVCLDQHAYNMRTLGAQDQDAADVAFDHAEEAMEGDSDLDPSDEDGFDQEEEDGFGEEYDEDDEGEDDVNGEEVCCWWSGAASHVRAV